MNPMRIKEFKELDALLKQTQWRAAIIKMQSWQVAYLALFQQEYPHHQASLKRAEFNSFWQKQLMLLGQTVEKHFHFEPQPGIHPMDWVSGYVFYLLALKSRENKQMSNYHLYLQSALGYQSFHALRLWMHEIIIRKEVSSFSSCQSLLTMVEQFYSIAKAHGSPGYLLLVNAYLQIALRAKGLSETQDMKKNAFAQLWRSLYFAKCMETQSKESVHNAYLGFGLSYSNALKANSIDELILASQEIAGDDLPSELRERIQKECLQAVTAQTRDQS
jgi:hypothetical protein